LEHREGERTEPATPRKREKARQEGRVARSVEVPAAAVLIASLLAMLFAAHLGLDALKGLARECIRDSWEADPLRVAAEVLGRCVLLCMPLAVGLSLVALGANLLQVGFLVSSKPLEPDLNRLNPLKGLQRLFSGQALAEMAKACAKVALLVVAFGWPLREAGSELERLLLLSPQTSLGVVGQRCARACARACALLVVLAALDYAYQRYRYERDLRMTKEELKDEVKEREGDPLVRSRLRSLQRALARRRMTRDVARADVVVTNPVELAVALRYEATSMRAPRVVAKGARRMARLIKEIARRHGVPLVENRPLAQALYRMVEVGEEIPPLLYRAVAELLAYIYRLRR